MSEWPKIPLSHLSSQDRWAFSIGPFGSKVTTEDYCESGVPFIRGVNLAQGIFTDANFVFISESKATEIESAVVTSGDLVFTRKGTIGQVSMIPRNPRYERYAISGSQVKARLDENRAAPEFYYYWFRSPSGQHSILERAVTTGVPSIANSLASIRNLSVPYPPLQEQHAVAGVLGALDSKIDACEQVASTSRRLGDAYFSDVEYRDLPDASFGELTSSGHLQFGDGYRTKRDEHGQPGLPILRVAEVLDGRLAPSFEDFVRDEYRHAMGTKISQPGDVVLTTKGTVGRVAIVPEGMPQFTYSPQVCYFRAPLGGSPSPAFLFYWFRSENFWSQARSRKSKTDMADYINLADMRSMRLAIPEGEPYRVLNERLTALERAASQALREAAALAQMRDTLLPKMMSGEIRVRDAEKVVEDVA